MAADQTQINKPKFNIPHAKKVHSPGSATKMKERAITSPRHLENGQLFEVQEMLGDTSLSQSIHSTKENPLLCLHISMLK
jgi:hypothetical protein